MFKFPARPGDPSDEAGLRTYIGGGGPETSGFADVPVPDELVEALRRHAAEVIACCLDAEADAYVRSHAHKCDAQGHALTVRNGLQPVRLLATGIGPVEVRIPKMRSRASAVRGYRSTLVTRYKRKAGNMQPGAPASYLRAWVGGHWQRMLTGLLGLPLGSTLHLPVARLDANWRRDSPAQVVRTRTEGAPLAVQVHCVALPAAKTLIAIVARHGMGGCQLLACREVDGPRQPAIDQLMSVLPEGCSPEGAQFSVDSLSAQRSFGPMRRHATSGAQPSGRGSDREAGVHATDPNTKIDAPTPARRTFAYKGGKSSNAVERDKRKCADSA